MPQGATVDPTQAKRDRPIRDSRRDCTRNGKSDFCVDKGLRLLIGYRGGGGASAMGRRRFVVNGGLEGRRRWFRLSRGTALAAKRRL